MKRAVGQPDPMVLDAERLLLAGAILFNGEYLGPMRSLKADDFSTSEHRRAADAIYALADRGVEVDELSVSDELGDRTYVAELITLTPSSSPTTAVRIVRDAAFQRWATNEVAQLSTAIASGGDTARAGVTRFAAAVARAGDAGTNAVEAFQSSWRAVDLTAALADTDLEPASLWTRSDGIGLLYPGRVHWFQGESESLKSWAAQAAVAEQLCGDGRVLYIDYEDDDRGIVTRLRALGVPADVLADGTRFVYVRPDEPLFDRNGKGFATHLAELDAHLRQPWTLAVIDGVTEAMTTEGSRCSTTPTSPRGSGGCRS